MKSKIHALENLKVNDEETKMILKNGKKIEIRK